MCQNEYEENEYGESESEYGQTDSKVCPECSKQGRIGIMYPVGETVQSMSGSTSTVYSCERCDHSEGL